MLTAALVLIALMLVAIWKEAVVLRGYAAVIAAECEGAAKSLDQARIGIDSIHRMMLELWACPTCLGSGHTDFDLDNPLGECATCHGTGRRNA